MFLNIARSCSMNRPLRFAAGEASAFKMKTMPAAMARFIPPSDLRVPSGVMGGEKGGVGKFGSGSRRAAEFTLRGDGGGRRRSMLGGGS